MPGEIRRSLGLGPGDLVAYEVREGGILLKRVEPFDAQFHMALSATLDEWASPEDEEAFRDL
jgi:bifunctional DNA-binding transcriptional regulator/antitoxin component of YhaV-PrlF toxin-antitoxin module